MNKNKKLLKIMYDQEQFTPLWEIDRDGLWINDDFYWRMKKISGYAPEGWITYTQNKPTKFWFGAYSQEVLDKEEEVGFANFTSRKFLKEFEAAAGKIYRQAGKFRDIYFEKFYKKEKKFFENDPEEVIAFLKNIRQASSYIMSYYTLTQPQRFYKFEEEIKKFLPDPDLELIATTGRSLTYASGFAGSILRFAQKIRESGLSYDKYLEKNPAAVRQIKKIIKQLGFLNWGYLGGELGDQKYFKKEVKKLLADDRVFAEELKKTNDLTGRIKKRNKLAQEIKAEWVKLADIMGQASVLRFDLQTCLLCILKYADNFIGLAKEKNNLTADEFASYYFEEILELIRSGRRPKKKDLEKRQKGFLTIRTSKEIRYYLADEARARIKDLLEFRKNEIRMKKEVKGTVASWPDKKQRKIVGKAFVLKSIYYSPKELEKFQDGDIFVATQTHPNLMPSLKRASAIITDEGGITCHAAIVSRELGIPCVIGTKIATKVLHDGDLVEVDADNGTVKILKK